MSAKSDNSSERLSEVMESAQKRVRNSVRFHTRAWKSNFDAVQKQGRKVLVTWMEEEVKSLDERVEKVCWNLHRPISWLTQKINHLDDRRVQRQENVQKSTQERRLQEDEVHRFADEGGPAARAPETVPAAATV